MDHLHITFDKLDVGAINDLVKHESCGAISLFVGTTRDNFENKEVITLEYEAYKPMALKQLQLICKELRAKWTELKHIAIYHRLGGVPVSEESVVIAISSPHREASLQAVAHAIEELKKRVPIWKKEQYKNSESTWKENKESHGLKAKKAARFDASMLTKIETDDVSSDLVQITVDDEEIKRRMDCFVRQKRREIDINNIIDYTNPKRPLAGFEVDSESDNVSTCARTDSVIVKQENSNCHLRVRMIKNKTGPQEKSSSYKRTLSKLMEQNVKVIKKEPGIEGEDMPPNLVSRAEAQKQRLEILENYLGLSLHSEKSIYERLKAVEDKVLKLETLSPEYKHFMQNDSSTMCSRCQSAQFYETNSTNSVPDYNQQNFNTVEDLDAIIERMEREQEEFDKGTCATSSNASTHEDDEL